jgi:hypothetical protein
MSEDSTHRLELIERHHRRLNELVEIGLSEEEIAERLSQEYTSLERRLLVSMQSEDDLG